MDMLSGFGKSLFGGDKGGSGSGHSGGQQPPAAQNAGGGFDLSGLAGGIIGGLTGGGSGGQQPAVQGGGSGGQSGGGGGMGGLANLAGGMGGIGNLLGGGGQSTGGNMSKTSAFQLSGPAGSTIGFTPGGGGLGDLNINLGDTFGGKGVRLGLGGGKGGGFPINFKGFTSGRNPARPSIPGRPQRREDKNPFAGMLKQDFNDIKDDLSKKGSGKLFEDPEFPALNSSLYFSQTPPRPFVWLRPQVS